MTNAQDAISIPIAYIEALTMMLGAFLIGYIGCYLYYNKRIKKQQLESIEKTQSLRKRIEELKDELDQLERSKSYQKDRMDQDYEQVQFANRAFSENVVDKSIELSTSSIDFDAIGYASEESKDNLQEINGIGPYTEEKLNKLGIYTFDQISKFTASDIANVTELIKFFPDRIKNDQWVAKARALTYGGSNNPDTKKDSQQNSRKEKTTS